MKASFAARLPRTPGIIVPVQHVNGSQISRLLWFGPRVRLSP